jgi:SOS-response transcriptional repressor LexA
LFINDNIEDYIAVPDRYINSNNEYFANIAKGDSMIGKGINDGDTLIFEKTNVLESANPKYDPIIIDVTNECFRIIGKLVCKFSGVE